MKTNLPKMLTENAGGNSACYRDEAELLENRLEFLDGKEKIIMTMRVRQGASFGQIAVLMGMHEATVARLIRRLQSQLLKGAFVTCLRNSDCLSREHIAIARDRYLSRLPLPLIAKKNNCTLYRVRTVLAELAALIRHQSPDREGVVGGMPSGGRPACLPCGPALFD